MTTPPGEAPLDFATPSPESEAPVCAGCQSRLTNAYWAAGSQVLCESCKNQVERAAVHGTGNGGWARAVLYGIGGMLAGAAVWYVVMKVANLEIGLIAILLGWLVGKGVKAGSGNRGGLRYQLLAVILTYLGIVTAYTPLVVEAAVVASRGSNDSLAALALQPDSLIQVGSTAVPEDAELQRLDSMINQAEAAEGNGPLTFKDFLTAMGGLLFALLILPVQIIIGDLPGGLISLIIYAIAFMHAWKLTQATEIVITGPFRVGETSPA